MSEYRVFFPAEEIPACGPQDGGEETSRHPTAVAVEKIIGLRFRDPDLAVRALTHSSFANESRARQGDYERLEFLGDAVLDYLAALWLYRNFPDMSEGELTRIRSALVRTETLAALSRKIGLGQVIRIGRGESRSGGRERETILCGVFEALIGALALDSGVFTAYAFLEPFLKRQADKLLERSANTDSKSLFQEWAQADRGITPSYKVVGEDGPDHDRRYLVAVCLGEEELGRGKGTSKQSAAQAAAGNALRKVANSSKR